jgi:hypothetical protein
MGAVTKAAIIAQNVHVIIAKQTMKLTAYESK